VIAAGFLDYQLWMFIGLCAQPDFSGLIRIGGKVIGNSKAVTVLFFIRVCGYSQVD
jgi:hypothetical protein